MAGDRNAAWTVETLNETVADELRALPRDIRLRLDYVTGIIRSEGFANIKMPHVRHLAGSHTASIHQENPADTAPGN